MHGRDLDALHALAAKIGRMLPEPVRIRPPTESGALLIRATRGCAWNRCRYCNLYRESATGSRPLADVLDDVALARALYGDAPNTVFFGDADLLATTPHDGEALVRTVADTFPVLERQSAYVIPASALAWEPAALKALRNAGLLRVYAELETGNALLRQRVERPETPDDSRDGLVQLKAAGFDVWVSILLGLGGEEHSAAHIDETVACINTVAPDVVRIRTLACGERQPLTAPVLDGRWELDWAGAAPSPIQTPGGTLDELRAVIRGITCDTTLLCDHASNFAPHVQGRLPAHRAALLATVDEAEAFLRAQKRPPPMRIHI